MPIEFAENYNNTFFKFNEKIAFIERYGLLRIEVEPEKFLEAKKIAEQIFDENEYENEKSVIELKIRQLLGDETLTQGDKITLQAAETFPKNKYLRILLIRDLSIDIPDARLNPTEKNELKESL